MTRTKLFSLFLPLLSLVALVLLPLAHPALAHATVTGMGAPKSPGPPQPGPRPGPEPGPTASPPTPEHGPRPLPAPGPTPNPEHPTPNPEPPSSPEPAPGPTPAACEADGDPSDCDNTGSAFGLFDLPGLLVDAMTSFLGTLVEQVMRPVRECLADTLLATPDVTRHADIKRLWTAVLGITAGVYVVFVTAGGITIMGYETVQTRYALRQIAPRLLLGLAAAATSLTVMGKAIGLSNALAHAIMAAGMSDAGQGMVERVLPFALFGAPGLKLYVLLLAIAMLALVFAVLIGFLVRTAVMALLAVCAPLMLACHAHPLTDPVARLWWRALAGGLLIQVAQSMTFVLALKLFFAPGAATLGIPKSDQLGTVLAGVSLFWVLFKIPGWTLQVVLRGTPVHNPHAPTGVRILKHLAMYRLMDHYLPGMRLLRGRGGSADGGTAGIGPWRGGSGSGGGVRPSAGGGPPGGARGRRGPGGTGSGGGGGSGRPGPGRSGSGGAGGRRRPGPSGGVAQGGRPQAGALGASGGKGRGAAGQLSPGATAVTGTHRTMTADTQTIPARPPTPSATPRPRQAPQPRAGSSAPVAASPRGPRAETASAQPRHVRQPALPVSTPTTLARSASSPRARQLALPVPATRVRVRPPRPVQLRLPLEPPRR